MYDRYDRQVRLIGREVQEVIQSLSISLMDYSKTMVGAEILKNLALLGVGKLFVNQKDTLEKLTLNEVTNLNDNLKTEIVEELDLNCDIKIVVDGKVDFGDESIIYICTRCLAFKTGNILKDCEAVESDIVEECLLGAIVVQELVKKVSGKTYLKEYTIRIE